jgi:hypothetical protein
LLALWNPNAWHRLALEHPVRHTPTSLYSIHHVHVTIAEQAQQVVCRARSDKHPVKEIELMRVSVAAAGGMMAMAPAAFD